MKANTKKIIYFIAAGFLLRLAAAAFCFHSDTIFINYFPTKLTADGVLNIYHYIDINFPADRLWGYYPPLTYYVIGAFQAILKPLSPGFNAWIQTVYFGGMNSWLLSASGTSLVFKYLLLMKLPYFFFDAVCLRAMFVFFGNDEAKRTRMTALWCLNPVIIYGVYMMGQVDIMPAAISFLAVLMFSKEKDKWGFLLLSVAALFKTYTLFIIIPVLILRSNHVKDYLKNILFCCIPFIVVLIPLYLMGGRSVLDSLFPKFYRAAAAESAGFMIQKAVFLFLYLFLAVKSFYNKEKGSSIEVFKSSLAVLMLLYIIFFVPVHYFVWVMPFIIVAVCQGMIPGWLYWFQIGVLFLYNLNSPGTTTHVFRAVNPDYFLSLQGIPDIMHSFSIRWGVVMLSARLVFTAVCVMIATDFAGWTSFFRCSDEVV